MTDAAIGQPEGRQRVIIVTGPSGAGRGTSLKVLEDLGCEAIDNLPLSLIPRLLSGPPLGRPLALGVDVRNREFSPEAVLSLLGAVGDTPAVTELLYLDCLGDVLLRRYSETRRRHPMAPQESPEEGIAREVELLAPLRARADHYIDTSELSPHGLRDEIKRLFHTPKGAGMAVTLQSFSFKNDVPRGLDMMFDTRFLRNPHWQEELRPLDGRDRAVADYVASDERYGAFIEKITSLLTFLLPAFEKEGKAHFSIGIGCTGGRHRSVAVTEDVANALAQAGWRVSIRHREMERAENAGAPAVLG